MEIAAYLRCGDNDATARTSTVLRFTQQSMTQRELRVRVKYHYGRDIIGFEVFRDCMPPSRRSYTGVSLHPDEMLQASHEYVVMGVTRWTDGELMDRACQGVELMKANTGKMVASFTPSVRHQLLSMSERAAAEFATMMSRHLEYGSNLRLHDRRIFYDPMRIDVFRATLEAAGHYFSREQLLDMCSVQTAESTEPESYTLITLLFGSYDRMPFNYVTVPLALSTADCEAFVNAYRMTVGILKGEQDGQDLLL